MADWLNGWFTEKELLWIILGAVCYGIWRQGKLASVLAAGLDNAVGKIAELDEKIDSQELSRELDRPPHDWGDV